MNTLPSSPLPLDSIMGADPPQLAFGHIVRNVNRFSTSSGVLFAADGVTRALGAFISTDRFVSIVTSLVESSLIEPLCVLSVWPLHATSVCLHPSLPVVAIGTQEGWVVVTHAVRGRSEKGHSVLSSTSLSTLLSRGQLDGQPRKSISITVGEGSTKHVDSFVLWSGSDVPITSLAFSEVKIPAQSDDSAFGDCLLVALLEGTVFAEDKNNNVPNNKTRANTDGFCGWHLMTQPSKPSLVKPETLNPCFPFLDAESIRASASPIEDIRRLGVLRQVVGIAGGEFAICGAHNIAFVTVKAMSSNIHTERSASTPSTSWRVDIWRMQPLPADAVAGGAHKGSCPPAEFVSVAIPDRSSREGRNDTFVFALVSSGLLVCFSATSGAASKWVDCRFAAVPTSVSSPREDLPHLANRMLTPFPAIALQCTPDYVFVLGANVARCFALGKWEIVDSCKVIDVCNTFQHQQSAMPCAFTGAFLMGTATLFAFAATQQAVPNDNDFTIGVSHSILEVPLTSQAVMAAALAAKAEGKGSKVRTKLFLVASARALATPFSKDVVTHCVSMKGGAFAFWCSKRLRLLKHSSSDAQTCAVAADLNVASAFPLADTQQQGGVIAAPQKESMLIASVAFSHSANSLMVLLVPPPSYPSHVAARVHFVNWDPSQADRPEWSAESSVGLPIAARGGATMSFDHSRCSLIDSFRRGDGGFICITTAVPHVSVSSSPNSSFSSSVLYVHTYQSTAGTTDPSHHRNGLSFRLVSSRQLRYTSLFQTSALSRASLFYFTICGDSPCLVLPTGMITGVDDVDSVTGGDLVQFGTCPGAVKWNGATQYVSAVAVTRRELLLATSQPCALFSCSAVGRKLERFTTREPSEGLGDDLVSTNCAKETLYEAVAVDESSSLAAIVAKTTVLQLEQGTSWIEWSIIFCNVALRREIMRAFIYVSEADYNPAASTVTFLTDSSILVCVDGTALYFDVPSTLAGGEKRQSASQYIASHSLPLEVAPPIEAPQKVSSLAHPTSTNAPPVVPPIDLTARKGTKTPPSGSVLAAKVSLLGKPSPAPKTSRVVSKSPNTTRVGVERRPMTARAHTAQRVSHFGAPLSPRPAAAVSSSTPRSMTPLQRQQQERGRSFATRGSNGIGERDADAHENRQRLEDKMAFLEAFQRENNDRVSKIGRVPSATDESSPSGKGSLAAGETVVIVAPTSRIEQCSRQELEFAEVLTSANDDSPLQSRQRELSVMLRDASSENFNSASPCDVKAKRVDPSALDSDAFYGMETSRGAGVVEVVIPLDTDATAPLPSSESPKRDLAKLRAVASNNRAEAHTDQAVGGSLVNVSQLSDDEPLADAKTSASSFCDPAKLRRLDIISARRSAAIQNVLAILKSIEPDSLEYESLRREIGTSSLASSGHGVSQDEADRSLETWSEINRLLHEELRRETSQ